jgi:hypothetical protein
MDGDNDVEASGDEDDPDFVDSDYEVDDGDDDLFNDNVDEGATDDGYKFSKGNKIDRSTNADGDDTTDDGECLDLPDSEGEGEVRMGFQSFKDSDLSNPRFKVGLAFDSVVELKRAITEYSVKERVDITWKRNTRKRLHAICDKDCTWELYGSVDVRSPTMVIKRYCGRHTCHRKWSVKRCTSKWLSEKYIESFRADQKMSLTNFARTVQKEWNLTPSRSKLARAKRLAMKKVMGDEVEQYSMLWDYGHELRRSNPGTSFFINLNGNLFSSLYMSLDACKRGFLAACRPIICLDGCHIKTKYGGIILTAVGIDPNDCIFPIAWAIVEVECLLSWKWFLLTLKQDLGIENTCPWTIMTDKQKVTTHLFIPCEY